MSCVAEPAEIELCRRRGDSFADRFTLKDETGAVIDITGFSFLLTVDPSSSPASAANNLFQLAGTIVDAVNGVVEFAPSAVESDIAAGTYYYDVQQTDDSGDIRTIIVGKYIISQDITK